MDCEPEKRVSLLYRVYSKLKQLVKPRLYLKYVTFIDKYSKFDKEQRDRIKDEIRSGQQGGQMLSEILLENQQLLDEKDNQLYELRKRLAREMLLNGHDLESIARETQLDLAVIETLKTR